VIALHTADTSSRSSNLPVESDAETKAASIYQSKSASRTWHTSREANEDVKRGDNHWMREQFQ